MNNNDIIVTKITDENRAALFRVAVSAYIGEACMYCEHEYETVDDIIARNPVVAAKEPMRLACGVCYQARQ